MVPRDGIEPPTY